MNIATLLIQKFIRLRFKWFFFLILTSVVVAVIGGFVTNNKKDVCDKCNVVLISIDTLSALHLPCYGYQRNTSPNLCAYADKNILFLNSYSQSPRTIDSHFSIFTSLYPQTHKMTDIVGDSLSEDHITLAQLFRMNGYQTIYDGPTNVQHMPLNRGIERGFNIIEEVSYKNYGNNWNNVYQKLIENTEKKIPSFFFLHTSVVHEPYLTGHKQKHLFTDLPEYSNIALTKNEYRALSQQFISFCANFILSTNPYVDKLNAINSENGQIAEKLNQAKNLQEGINIFNTLPSPVKQFCYSVRYQSKINENDPNQVEYLKALYDEQIYKMDKKLGNFLARLSDPKLSENTIVIITSDHGEEFMEHGSLYHGKNLYRTSVQVPLIIHIPGIKPKKINEIVQGIDIYPTAISLTGITPKSRLEGIDLSGIIKGEKNAKTNKYVRSELGDIIGIGYQDLRFYYRETEKSLIGIYDLTDDPQEQNNLRSVYPKAVDNLDNFLNLLQTNSKQTDS